MPVFESKTQLTVPAARRFRWHARPGAFDATVASLVRVEIRHALGWNRGRRRLVMRVGSPPLSCRWVAVHSGYRKEAVRRRCRNRDRSPSGFTSTSSKMPEPDDRSSSIAIDYTIPFGTVGESRSGGSSRPELEKLFRYRGAVTAGDLARHAPYVDEPRFGSRSRGVGADRLAARGFPDGGRP
jgi:hypothetical protein